MHVEARPIDYTRAQDAIHESGSNSGQQCSKRAEGIVRENSMDVVTAMDDQHVRQEGG